MAISQNVDQIKIKIKKLIPPGAERFVRFIQKKRRVWQKPISNFVGIKSIKKWSPSFHIADIFSLLKYDYFLKGGREVSIKKFKLAWD